MRRPISVRPKPKTKKTTANYRPPSNSAVSRTKPSSRPEKSLGSRLMSGIRNAGRQIKSDFRHATGQQKYTGADLTDYNKRTADSLARGYGGKDRKRESLGRRIKRQRREAEAAAAEAAMQPEAPVTPPEAGIPSLRVTPEMRRAALEIFEAQQGAGQMPYYMAAARQDQNASPAFNYAAQNYATLGGAQRLAPRPMEMMSVAERQQINRMAEGMLPQPMPTPEQQYQQGMDMVMRGGKGGPRTGPQLPPGMVGLPRTPDYGGRPQQQPSQFSPFTNMLASRFGGFGGY